MSRSRSCRQWRRRYEERDRTWLDRSSRTSDAFVAFELRHARARVHACGDPRRGHRGAGSGGRYPRPRLSVVARDWDQSLTLSGPSGFVMDRVRISRSTRMMFGRARLDVGRFVPYVQAGFGLWRPDRDAAPLFMADTEYATQLGAGAEFRIASRGVLALESDYTIFYRETREPQFIPSPKVLGGFAGLRAEF